MILPTMTKWYCFVSIPPSDIYIVEAADLNQAKTILQSTFLIDFDNSAKFRAFEYFTLESLASTFLNTTVDQILTIRTKFNIYLKKIDSSAQKNHAVDSNLLKCYVFDHLGHDKTYFIQAYSRKESEKFLFEKFGVRYHPADFCSSDYLNLEIAVKNLGVYENTIIATHQKMRCRICHG